MLCGGLRRAGSYEVGRQAAPPKVTSLKHALYVGTRYDGLIISFRSQAVLHKAHFVSFALEISILKHLLPVCICKHNPVVSNFVFE